MLSEPLVKLNSVYVKVQEALLHLRGDLLVGDTGVVGKAVGGTARIFDAPAFYAQQVRQILRKYGTDAHLFVPGVGYLNGFAAGNYLESTGQTNASVDGAVGLVLDAAGSVGAELVTTPSIVAVNIGGPVFTNYATGASVTSGKTYKITYTVSGYSGSGNVGFAGTVFNGHSAATANGTYVNTMVATGTGAVEMFSRSTNTCQFSNISIREVTGTHAAQATTANKPTLRRGIVNLLTQNGDFSNAAWTRTNVNILGSVQAPDGSNTASNLNFVFVSPITRLYQDATVQSVNGTRYTFAVWMRSATPCKISIGVQRSGPADPEQAEVDVTATWQLFVFSHSGAFTGTSAVRGIIFSYDAAFNKNIEVWRPGLFQGHLTAQQIIAAGGIPLTTTAPASSSAGAYAWQFDGSNDALALPGPLFQQADDHCVVVACSANTLDSTYRRVFTQENGSPTVCEINGHITGFAATWRDDLAVATSITTPAIPAGEVVVLSARKVGNTRSVRNKGVQVGVDVRSIGTTTLGPSAYIGNRAAGDRAFNGLIYPIIAIKGTVSDSDLRVLEKWLGSIAGVAIA